MDEKLLQHVGYYGHIYGFVAGSSRSLDEIKEYLVKLGENNSTVKTHMQMLTGERPGMFRVNGDMVSVDSAMARDLVAEFNSIFEPLLVTEAEKNAELQNLRAENEKLKKQLDGAKKRTSEVRKLDKKKVEASKLVFPKVLIIDSLQVGPIKQAKDKIFMDTKTYSIEVEEYISKYGLLKDSFYRELDSKLNLSQENYRKKTFHDVFSQTWIARRLMELKGVQSKLPQKKLSMKEKMQEHFHISEEEAQKQVQYLTGRAISVQEILANQKLSNQEKIALYVFNSPYRNTEFERLLNYAGDECIDANWLITLLESPELCRNYEGVRDLIRQCSKASEWAMKKHFAEELISGDWYITANYGGRETKFQLVPVDELNEIRDLLGVEIKDFNFDLDKTMKESDDTSNAESTKEALVQKGSFVRTVPLEADDEFDDEISSYGENMVEDK